MAAPIEEPQDLTGADVYDQVGEQIGSVEQLYTDGGDGEPSWAAVKVTTGLLGREFVLVPLARLKYEEGQVRVPYSKQHLLDAPRPDNAAEPTDEESRELSDYYGVRRGDQPADDNPDSYASQMPEESGAPRPVGESE